MSQDCSRYYGESEGSVSLPSPVEALVAALLALSEDERDQVFSRVGAGLAQVVSCKRRFAGPVYWPGLIGADLFDAYGRRVAVIRRVDTSMDQIDITRMQDANRQFMSGWARYVRIEAEGVTE